ncbi:MAG: host attachment protein [Gammaproteobacteria bacterium]|nr:host attachment protein [Gammaproteobacteria bacterium]
MTWVLLLNSNECRVFSFSKKNHQLDLLEEIHHPENKGKNKDIVSDRPGHYSNDHSGGGSYAPHTDPKEVKIDQFVLEVCHFLDEARTHQKYQELIVIADSKMHGHLTKHLNKNVEKLIIQHIQKDVVFLKPHELLALLLANPV